MTEQEKILNDLEKRLDDLYKQAWKEQDKELKTFIAKFDAEDKAMQERLKAGSIDEAYYKQWRLNQIGRQERWQTARDNMASRLNKTDKIAEAYINNTLSKIYNVSQNHVIDEVGKEVGVSFTLAKEKTLQELMRDTNHVEFKTVRVNPQRNYAWNREKIQKYVTSGILQGKSIPKLTDDFLKVMGNNRNSAIRNARTCVTSAQNSGTLNGMKDLEEMGITVEKVWVATSDDRTRDSHAEMDGESVPIDEPFSNGLMFPADADGEPHEVYNCRCTMITKIVDFKEFIEQESQDYFEEENVTEENITEENVIEESIIEENITEENVVDGDDISLTWERRPEQFDFDIEDVLNAQGFDGLPRVVSADEFDNYVSKSNFIAQRTYSAPSQEILDEYREQLYNGKWYVDCSNGGAQYGQGMYCASDYTGTLTDGIKEEMRHYKSIGESKGNGFAYTETFTIDSSANVFTLPYGQDAWEYIIDIYQNNAIRQSISLTNKKEETEKILDIRKQIEKNYNDFLNSKLSMEDLDEQYKVLRANENEILSNNEDISKIIKDIQNKSSRMNAGSMVASMGYDVINAEGHGGSASYSVILNRTKVIFKGE